MLAKTVILPHEGVGRCVSLRVGGIDTAQQAPNVARGISRSSSRRRSEPGELLGRRGRLLHWCHILYDILMRWQSHLTHLARASFRAA